MQPQQSISKALMKTLNHRQVQDAVDSVQLIDESLTEDELENDNIPKLEYEERLTVLKQTVSSYYVANSLQEMSKTAV